MNDRDRLAADLDAVTMSGMTDAEWLADRLIARGWTRLDEERLARALLRAVPGYHRWMGWPPMASADEVRHRADAAESEARVHAAAIAKAYREDTDATD